MANLIGIDYYRLVTETGPGSWAQVYAKVPMNRNEFEKYGALWGVVRLRGLGDLVDKGIELINQIDELATSEEDKGHLLSIIETVEKQKGDAVFVWMYLDDGGFRRIKVGGSGMAQAVIYRSGKKVILKDKGRTGVVMGAIRTNDRLLLGVDGILETMEQSEILTTSNLMKKVGEIVKKIDEEESEARAGLVLDIKEMERQKAEESMKADLYDLATVEKEPIESEMKEEIGIQNTSGTKKVTANEVLVGEKVVGVGGIKQKIFQAQQNWRESLKKWKSGALLKREERKKQHRWILILGGAFLVILGISVGLGMIKAKRDKEMANYRSVFEPLEKKREEAEASFSLNPVGARELIRSIQAEIQLHKNDYPQKELQVKITDFEKKVEASWQKVSGEQKKTMEEFFDLSLVRAELKGTRIAYDGKTLEILDSDQGSVTAVSYPDKKASVVLGKGGSQEWKDISMNKNGVTVLMTSGLTGIVNGKKISNQFDAAVGEPIAVDSFGDAVYVLDKGNGEIWRYIVSSDGYGDRRRWLTVDLSNELKKAKDMAIDLDIWILEDNGKLSRLRRGKKENYGLTDTPADFSPTRVAVSDSTNKIALMDPAKSRVVIFDKESGAFVKQILVEGGDKANDLVWLDEGTLVVLANGKLWKLGVN